MCAALLASNCSNWHERCGLFSEQPAHSDAFGREDRVRSCLLGWLFVTSRSTPNRYKGEQMGRRRGWILPPRLWCESGSCRLPTPPGSHQRRNKLASIRKGGGGSEGPGTAPALGLARATFARRRWSVGLVCDILVASCEWRIILPSQHLQAPSSPTHAHKLSRM